MMPRIRNRPQQKAFRQELRSNGTASEAVMWSQLKGRKLMGRKFRRQDGFGPFVVDFHCPDEHLVIELDGSIHDQAGSADHDEARDAYLARLGLRVLRFDNKSIMDDLEGVLEVVIKHFTTKGQERTDMRKARHAQRPPTKRTRTTSVPAKPTAHHP